MKSPDHRSGLVEYDGDLLYQVDCGYQAASNGTTKFGYWVAPCNGKIVAVNLRVITAVTHASAELNIGITSDTDSLLDAYDLTSVTAGYYDLVGDATMVSTTVSKGSAYHASLTSGDTTGDIALSLVIRPGT